MKTTRLIILTVAIIAALLAAFIAIQLSKPPAVSTAPVIQREPVVNILAAAGNLAVGDKLDTRSFQWVKWPKETVPAGFILQQDRPEAPTELTGSVVRLPMFAGEAIRPEKLADARSGVLSAILPAGKRALSIDITVSNSAGGLILPNDRVDVIAVRDIGGTQVSDVILSNIRVLAVDQATAAASIGEKFALGNTATLELTGDQAQALTTAKAASQQLSLGLRSMADAGEPDNVAPAHLLGTKTSARFVQVIKSGSIQPGGQLLQADTNSSSSELASPISQSR